MFISARSAVIVSIVAATLAGCEKKTAPSTELTQPVTSAAKPPATNGVDSASPSVLSDDARQRIERVLASYETIRDELARDDIAATTKSAETLEQAAKNASTDAPVPLRPHLSQLAGAARQMKEMPKKEASEVRGTFGQVSQALIALLSTEPSLQTGRHVFECPMAQGYKKWVQPTEHIANPYMGKQMLACGSPSKWEGK